MLKPDILWGYFSGADTRCTNSANSSPQCLVYYDANKNATDYTPQVNTDSYAFPTDLSRWLIPTSTVATLSDNTCNEQARLSSNITGNNPIKGNNASFTDDGSFETKVKKQVLLPVIKVNNDNSNTSSAKVIKGSNENNFYIIDSLIEVYLATKNVAVLNNAKNINNSLITTNNQEQNQKDLNDIYCVFVEDDSLVTSGQINYIKNLALMCPFTEGLSVYQARGLMRTWDDSTFYYNPCESTIPTEYLNNSRFANGLISSEGNAIALTVYPNPSNGILNIKISSNNCIFDVYDLMGRQIMNRKLNEGETKVDISSLNNGTYLYKITQSNVVIKADKLILNK